MNIRQVVNRKAPTRNPSLFAQTGLANMRTNPPKQRNSRTTSSLSSTDVNAGQNTPTRRYAPSYNVSSTSSRVSTPTSSTTDSDSSRMILAMCEGRGEARQEIGMAALDICRPELGIYQVSDTEGYNKTLMAINYLNPVEILIPVTLSESRLVKIIKDKFGGIVVTPMPRRFFNSDNGLRLLKQYCAQVYTTSLQNIQPKYYALAATAALINNLELHKQTTFACKTLKVTYLRTDDVTSIDCDTAYRLELVTSTRGTNKKASLFGILNHCITNSGKRFLRSSILQPLCSELQIDQRLQAVQELATNPDLLSLLQTVLQNFIRVDSLLTLCIQAPKENDNFRTAELHINYILLLKGMLNAIPTLIDSISLNLSVRILEIKEKLSSVNYDNINENITSILHDDVSANMGYMQRCYAIKPDVNELLDLKRRCYSGLIDNIRILISDLAKQYNLPLYLTSNASKGYHIAMKMGPEYKKTKAADFPPEFINVVKHARSFTMTTMKVIEISRRLKNVFQDIQQLTNIIIEFVLSTIRGEISSLYILCESIGELDLIQSLAETAKIPNYTRPRFSPNVLNITDGRHPILEHIIEKNTTPNSIMASELLNFHILTGPNMSGKSIYIKQVALLHIMAQIGSFVPAAEATFRVTDMILARINFDDSIECDASTFQLDIREMRYIIDSITPRTLLILDELCRGTVFDEGSAIAWVLCEQFLDGTAFVFCATHYLILTKLADMYMNVTNFHMESIEREVDNEIRLTYTYHLKFGITQLHKYGLAAARVSALPKSVVSRATELCMTLKPSITPSENVEQKDENHFKYNYIANVKFQKDLNKLTPELLNKLTENFKNQLNILESLNLTSSKTSITFNNIVLDTSIEPIDETMSKKSEDFFMEGSQQGVTIPTTPSSIAGSVASYNFLDYVQTVYSDSEAGSEFKSPYPVPGAKEMECSTSQIRNDPTDVPESIVTEDSSFEMQTQHSNYSLQPSNVLPEPITTKDSSFEMQSQQSNYSVQLPHSIFCRKVTTCNDLLSNFDFNFNIQSQNSQNLEMQNAAMTDIPFLLKPPKNLVRSNSSSTSNDQSSGFNRLELPTPTSISRLFSDENNDEFQEFLNQLEPYKPEENLMTFRYHLRSDQM